MSFLLTFNHDRIDPAVSVFIGFAGKVGEQRSGPSLLVKDGDLGGDRGRHGSFRIHRCD